MLTTLCLGSLFSWKNSLIIRVDCAATNNLWMELTKITDLSFDQTIQLLWSTLVIPKKSTCSIVSTVFRNHDACSIVPSLALVYVYLCSFICEVIKIWEWSYVGNSARVLSFQEVCTFRCLMEPWEHHLCWLSEKLCKSVFSRLSRCSTITSTEFAVFVLDKTYNIRNTV